MACSPLGVCQSPYKAEAPDKQFKKLPSSIQRSGAKQILIVKYMQLLV